MSYLSVRGERSTESEITALTNLASLSVSGAGEFIRKTGVSTFENASPSGSGTVTSVSVVTANGVSGSVATATSTPAITLTLGDITPSKVNGLTISTTTGTLTVTNGKTLSISNSLTLAGTDSTTITFPTVSSTLAATADVQVFTSDGTWTKPAGAKWVEVVLIGAGGGGGSGRKGAAGTDRGGGGGGQGGGYSRFVFRASLLGASESVVVGVGGAGGAAVTVNSTDGNVGTTGESTTFGSWLWAEGGDGGGPGMQDVAGYGGGSADDSTYRGRGTEFRGQQGGAGGLGGPGPGAPSSDYNWCPGGGGGAAIGPDNLANSGNDGANGMVFKDGVGFSAGAGGATSTVGGAGTSATANTAYGGGSGGGGGSSTSGNAGAGGNGGLYGAGAGGGGAAVNSVGNSGAGGIGADGIAIVTTYF